MCGIVGSLALHADAGRVSAALLNQMADSLRHRGPDGGRIWISRDRSVGLGFRRLAIIDLSASAMQPLCNEDESVYLVFNGEIYNHAELRSELEGGGGHAWKTDHADSEVIVHAFEEWGIDSLSRFRGMFAMAIWDGRAKTLWLVRDRIGIKPLYYMVHQGRLTFASEIKALLQDPSVPRVVDEEALYNYLSFLTTPAPTTLFAGIKKLPGGHWLRVDSSGQVRIQRYWDAWDEVAPLENQTDEEIAESLISELRTAVKLRKVSDVPVGVFLSGGIDSSTNAALFSEGEAQAIKTFSIGYEGEYETYTNELHHARRMASLVGAEHHELLLTQDDLLEFLPRMVQLQDEPIADPVCVPIYYLSKLARDNGVVVCQVGEGADELFWGYPHWKRRIRVQRADDLPVPGIFKRLGLAGLELAGKEKTVYYEWLRRGAEGLPVFWGGAEAFTENEKSVLLSPRLREKFSDLTSWDVLAPIRRRFEQSAWEPSHLNWMTYLDLNMRLPELLLMRVDKMTMGVSLEGRVPFLDHRFVALALGIPTTAKCRRGELKAILKKAVRGVIPDDLIDRKKQGFGVPVYEWLFDRLGDHARAVLARFCESTDYLNPREVVRYLDSGGRGPQAWYLLNFALWWEEYVGRP